MLNCCSTTTRLLTCSVFLIALCFIDSSGEVSNRYVDAVEARENNGDNAFSDKFLSQSEILENLVIGCLYDSRVCSDEERCIDDNLFGTCAPAYIESFSFKYRIPRDLLSELKTVLLNLLREEYTWHDVYSQCVIRAILLSSSVDAKPDFSYCSDFRNSGDIQKREELLQRKKYQYQLDIPEKRLPRLDDSLSIDDANLIDNQELPGSQPPSSYQSDWETFESLPQTDDVWNDNSDSDNEDARLDYASMASQQEPFDDGYVYQDLQSNYAVTPEDAKTIGDLLDGNLEESKLNDQELRHIVSVLKGLLPIQDDAGLSLPTADEPVTDSDYDNVGMEQQLDDTAAKLKFNQKQFTPSREKLHVKLLSEFKKRDAASSVVDGRFLWIQFAKPSPFNKEDARRFSSILSRTFGFQLSYLSTNAASNTAYFAVDSHADISSKKVVATIRNHTSDFPGFQITSEGLGKPNNRINSEALVGENSSRQRRRLATTMLVCGVVVAFIVALIVLFIVQRYRSSKRRLQDLTGYTDASESQDYQDLIRQRINEKSTDTVEPLSASAQHAVAGAKGSPNSSTGSWSDDPITTDMDVTTGHIILNYMEEYLSTKEKLEQEWSTLCSYEADQSGRSVGAKPENADKNRYPNLLPYDHSRVTLNKEMNQHKSDYINANYIYDSDPKIKAYILAQGPLTNTVADFWQMVWETGAVVIVNLTKQKSASGENISETYWPAEGSQLFHHYEIHLVSEHIWCDDYLVRNFYLKNLNSGEARTVTMFHFLGWEEDGLPSTKTLLEFRRKVNKSYKGKSSPVVIHCSDGCGRSGTFCHLDLALNRIAKGVKEIDLAATLEHLRDQRMGVVKTKNQFEFVMTAIAEEVNSILRTLSQTS